MGEDTVVFRLNLQQFLQQQRATKKLCDVTFFVGNSSVVAHRCLLVAVSEYFDRLLCGSFREGLEDHIDLSDVFTTVQPLEFIVDYLYGNEMPIPEQHLAEILNGANLFMLHDLTIDCVHFLTSRLTLRNCFTVWALADFYRLPEVYSACQYVATCRFLDTLLDTEMALDIPAEYLMKFIEAGLGHYCSPEVFSGFLDKWTECADPLSRAQYDEAREHILEGLLKEKCPMRNMWYLKQHAIPENMTQKQILYDYEEPCNIKSLQPPRDHVSQEEVLVWSPDDNNCTLLYRPNSNQWLEVGNVKRKAYLDENILTGMGKDNDLVWFGGMHGCRMQSLVDNSIQQIPPVSAQSHMYRAQYFGINGVLYCLAETYGGFISYPDRRSRREVSLFVYEEARSHWKKVCHVTEVIGALWKKPFLLQQEGYPIFILLQTTDTHMTLFSFHPEVCDVEKHREPPNCVLASVENKQVQYLRGTARGEVVIGLERQEIIYSHQTLEWTLCEGNHNLPISLNPNAEDVQFLHKLDLVVYATSDRKDPIRSVYQAFCGTCLKTGTSYFLPPSPTRQPRGGLLLNQVVPTEFLNKLRPVCLLDSLDKTVFGEEEIQVITAKCQKRIHSKYRNINT